MSEVLSAVNGIWAVPILRHLASGVSRPGDLLAAINTEVDNRLRLRHGIDDEPPDSGVPPRKQSSSPTRLAAKVMFEALARMVESRLVRRAELQGYPRQTHYSLTPRGHEILDAVSKLGARGRGWWPMPDEQPEIEGLDLSRPSAARMWNLSIGGQDWRDVDQRVTSAVLEVMPKLAVTARLTRRLQYEAVLELVSEYGVRQFLDLGTGLPTAGAVHEIAQRAAPESRVVYVDNDPQVGIHARALLVSSPQGAASFLEADLREPDKILAHATGILDFSQPVAIFCLMVLHFLADADDPWGIVRRLAEGSGDRYLVVAHAGTDFDDEAAQAAERAYNERSPVAIHTRSRHEVQRFFTDAGFDLLAPGLVMPAQRWPAEASDLLDVPGYFGMGWRPAVRHAREANSRAGSQDATRQ